MCLSVSLWEHRLKADKKEEFSLLYLTLRFSRVSLSAHSLGVRWRKGPLAMRSSSRFTVRAHFLS